MSGRLHLYWTIRGSKTRRPENHSSYCWFKMKERFRPGELIPKAVYFWKPVPGGEWALRGLHGPDEP